MFVEMIDDFRNWMKEDHIFFGKTKIRALSIMWWAIRLLQAGLCFIGFYVVYVGICLIGG